MSKAVEIFVRLVDEDVDVWRPVQAEHLRENTYRIVDQPYRNDVETWQFGPGATVACELIDSGDGRILAAVKATDDDRTPGSRPAG